uniref:Uncharacterized protein n=1 Tax=Cannabis sativa TaxID=3483 RepID=A0A803Q9H7_CANSA
MLFKLPGILNAKKNLRRSLSGLKEGGLKSGSVPKGYIAVYVGGEDEEKKRHVVPVCQVDNDKAINICGPMQ